MKPLPVIRNAGEQSDCSRPAGQPEAHKVHRTLPARSVQTKSDIEYLQAEDGFPFFDEISGNKIFDDWKKD